MLVPTLKTMASADPGVLSGLAHKSHHCAQVSFGGSVASVILGCASSEAGSISATVAPWIMSRHGIKMVCSGMMPMLYPPVSRHQRATRDHHVIIFRRRIIFGLLPNTSPSHFKHSCYS
jgi:hypothetical protein